MAHATTTTIAKTIPKSYIFPVAFHGQKGGLHFVKMRFKYEGKIIHAISETSIKKAEEDVRARALHRNKLCRIVYWYEKAVGTNYGRGRFRGLLVYTLPSREAINHPKIKKGWIHAGMKFWFGD